MLEEEELASDELPESEELLEEDGEIELEEEELELLEVMKSVSVLVDWSDRGSFSSFEPIRCCSANCPYFTQLGPH